MTGCASRTMSQRLGSERHNTKSCAQELRGRADGTISVRLVHTHGKEALGTLSNSSLLSLILSRIFFTSLHMSLVLCMIESMLSCAARVASTSTALNFFLPHAWRSLIFFLMSVMRFLLASTSAKNALSSALCVAFSPGPLVSSFSG